MKKEKAINDVLKQVNWDLVLACAKELNYDESKKPTRIQLIEELTDILKNTIETEKSQLVTDFWTINYEMSEEGFILEAIFTPMAAWVDTFGKKTKRDKVDRLEQRLKLALEIEDYEKANKIKKSLEKLLPKGK